jgi:hypothetical protein
MSDLQLGLIVIGVLIVVAVYAFNRYQELQLRRKVENRFAQRPDDVLMQEPPQQAVDTPEERIEPHFETTLGPSELAAPMAPSEASPSVASEDAEPAVAVAPERVVPAAAAPAAAAPATTPPASTPAGAEIVPGVSVIDYGCEIEAEEPFGRANVEAFLKAANSMGKPVLVRGRTVHSKEWLVLPSARDESIGQLQVVLQLVDRSGAVNRVQLSSLRDLCYALAGSTGGSCRCGDIDQAAHRAAEIDRFCSQVDVSLGCNVVARSGAVSGTKLRGLLESAGFTLEPSGRFVLRAEDGNALLTAEDVSGEPLSVERLRAGPIAGVTLAMDVPRAPGGARVFERMLEIARHLAHALDGVVVDDNRVELTDNGLKVIRQHLKSVHAAMDSQGIAAGSPLALRLFS